MVTYEFVIINGIHMQYIILSSILIIIAVEMVTLGTNNRILNMQMSKKSKPFFLIKN
jgi:hypothetical protein